jgi:class 3 adenylate cyclase
VVEANGATAAQLIGDELMAFYGAPRYFRDHAFRSIKTACEQVEKVDELCARYKRAGKRMCRCGIGISAGEVVLGNMGSASRQAYTAALLASVTLAVLLRAGWEAGSIGALIEELLKRIEPKNKT